AFQTLMPWAAYCGIAALVVAAFGLLFARSRIERRGVAVAVLAFAAGASIAYVPWHYDQMRETVPRVNDITTDPDNPPAFVVVVPLRASEGINPVAYQGSKIAALQRQAYPDIGPLTIALAPSAAFHPALDPARPM